MELKNRKAIQNKVLPKFDLGLTPNALPDEKMGLLKMENSMLKSGQFVGNSTGGLEPNMLAGKAAKGNLLGGLANKAGGIMNIATGAMDFIGTMNDISTNKISSDEMMGSGGTSNESANGISYQESKVDQKGIQNQIDATAKAGTMAAMGKGAALGGAIGSVIPGLGTVAGGAIGGVIGGIAGLFGSSKAKREAERQKRIAINRTTASNTQNRETAYTTGLRNEFNRENVTDTSQSLFHAEEGIEGAINPRTGATYKKHVVNTAYGKVKAPQNAWVSKGEVIRSKDGSLYRVPSGDNDTARAYLQNGDSVYSKKIINPETGNSIADDAASYAMAGQLDRLDMNQNVGRMMKEAGRRKTNLLPGFLGGTNKYKCLPGFEGGTGFWGKAWNTIGKGLGDVRDAVNQLGDNIDIGNVLTLGNAFLTAGQRDARAEGGLRAPKSFVANPYEQDALQQLNSLHSDYYPVWAQNREIEGRGKSSIMQSGGLSAGQKMLGYMGLTNQTQQNNASALFEHQGRENALRAQAARASLEAGNQSATRQQQAYQWDEDMLAKAHAARENMLETSAYDRQNALESFFANKFKKNQFDRTMNLYESQQKNDAAKTKAIVDALGNNNKPSQPTDVGTDPADIAKPDAANTATDAAKKVADGAPKQPTDVEPPIPTLAKENYLKRGSRGEDVKKLQDMLNEAFPDGAYINPKTKKKEKLNPDKIFGGKTEAALKRFQNEILGYKTRAEGWDGIYGDNSNKGLIKYLRNQKKGK